MTIRVVIADDHEVVRAGVRSVLSEDPEFEIVGEAATGEEAVAQSISLKPDVVLLDIGMPGNDGLNALTRIKMATESTFILVLAGHDSPSQVARAVSLGANGCLQKTANRSQVVEATRRVAAGETIWTRDELRRATGAAANSGSHVLENLGVALTPRETEVLRQLAHGLTNKEIGQALGISYETVKEHVQHILRKVGVSDRTQAAVWAVRNGLL